MLLYSITSISLAQEAFDLMMYLVCSFRSGSEAIVAFAPFSQIQEVICAMNITINGSAFYCLSWSHLKPHTWKAPGRECVQCSELCVLQNRNKCAKQCGLIILSIRGFLQRYFSAEQCFLFIYTDLYMYVLSVYFFARGHLLLSCESYLKEAGLQ